MIKPVVTSHLLLRLPSADVVAGDPVAAACGQDLLDTLAAHAHECAGMAANMIGVRLRVIVVADGSRTLLMYNPEILEGTSPYDTEEGCLSLSGLRPCTRYRSIRASYLDADFAPRTRRFTGYTAQIIQHEADHCNGVVI